jgi:DNA-binding Xre family transcriptional regulator
MDITLIIFFIFFIIIIIYICKLISFYKDINPMIKGKNSTSIDNIYNRESAKARFAIHLADILLEENCTIKDLARWIDISDERMSQIISADENISIETLADIALVLNRKLEVRFIKIPIENSL